MTYFETEKLTDVVTRIKLPTGVYAYLVEGNERVALLDAGCGIGLLKPFVETLTDKPIIVLLTHGHVDHAVGAHEFDTVYLNQLDVPLAKLSDSIEIRKNYAANGMPVSKYEDGEFITVNIEKQYEQLNDKDVFDLGGIHIVAYACPGHTMGSMVFLIEEERSLLVGDTANGFTFLFDESTTGITTYAKNIARIIELTEGKYDTVYESHMSGDAPKNLLTEILELCDEIRIGLSDKEPFSFMKYQAVIAKRVNMEKMQREDGKYANICYDPTRVFE